MNNSYQEFHANIINAWVEKCEQQAPFSSYLLTQNQTDIAIELLKSSDEELFDEPDALYSKRLKQIKAEPLNPESREIGQWLVTQAVAKYAHIVPLIPRDLFWYFGGDCMHYLVDEEIEAFQKLDERFHDINHASDEKTSYAQIRSQQLGLH